MVERQLAHLRHRRLHQALIIEAEGGAPQPGNGLDVFLAGVIPDPHALAVGDDHGADLLMGFQIGIRVQHAGDVARGGRVRSERRGWHHG